MFVTVSAKTPTNPYNPKVKVKCTALHQFSFLTLQLSSAFVRIFWKLKTYRCVCSHMSMRYNLHVNQRLHDPGSFLGSYFIFLCNHLFQRDWSLSFRYNNEVRYHVTLTVCAVSSWFFDIGGAKMRNFQRQKLCQNMLSHMTKNGRQWLWR